MASSLEPDHLYIKITSPSQKITLNKKIAIRKLVLRQFIVTGVPQVGGAPYTPTLELSMPNRFTVVMVKSDRRPSIPLPLTGAYNFVQFQNGYDLRGAGSNTVIGDIDVELNDGNGTAAQFSEAHFWFTVQ